MRYRAEESAPEAVHFLEEFRAQRLFSQLGSLHSHGGVIGEGSKQVPIGGDAGRPRTASTPTGRPKADKATVWSRSGIGPVSHADRNPGVGIELVQLLWRYGLARRGRDRQTTLDGEEEGHPRNVEYGPDRDDDRLQQVLEGAILHQELGKFIEALGLDGPFLRFVAGGFQVGDHLGDQKHHDRVHTQRDPVLAGAYGKRVVGRYEHEVVDEETSDRAGDPGPEPTDDHGGDDGDHEHEGGGGDTRMGAERQHGGSHPAAVRTPTIEPATVLRTTPLSSPFGPLGRTDRVR